MISYVLPTRDRPDDLARTLAALGGLRHADCPGEVIVVDNASSRVPVLPDRLANGMPVTPLMLSTNEGASARNAGVARSSEASEWIVMLDDDSHPIGDGFIPLLVDQPDDVAAVMADISIPATGRREYGGLPEVFVGCGVALRRGAFLEVGGYDAAFGFYAEEYDLAARLIGAGHRVVFEPAFRVAHHKSVAGRDMNEILRRLVRNNGWIVQRYAPSEHLRLQLDDVLARYRHIAETEEATEGFEQGLVELQRSITTQERTPLACDLYERFVGMGAARAALGRAFEEEPFGSAQLVDPGKHAWVVRRALEEMGVEVVEEGGAVDVIATLSPGPMLDAIDARPAGDRRVLAPWAPGLDPVVTQGRRGRRRAG